MTVLVPLVTLILSLLAVPLAAAAPPAGKVWRMGYLVAGSSRGIHEAFRQGLRDLGYVEGQNLTIETRYAEGQLDRLPALAAELVRLPVDLIVAQGVPAALAAKYATTTIPIVMVGIGDPLGTGLVASLAQPGGNITGVSILGVELAGKRLELLKEALPQIARVAVLWDPANPANAIEWRETQAAARALGVQLQSWEVRGPEDFERAFAAMTRERPDALFIVGGIVTGMHREQIADFALKSRLPTMYIWREAVYAGGLMSYGANDLEMYRYAATYVDKILKGAKPADLPVEQPTKFVLVINLKTAKALGVTIPPHLLVLADEVIR